jgi:steroid delta-isomerase-like uncharacterized protein
MSVEDNKANVRSFIEEVFNKQNLAIIDELIAEDYVVNGVGGQQLKGPDGVRMMITMYTTAFPDLHMIIDDLIGEGDTVACRFTTKGTHKGEFMGIPPTGKMVSISGYSFNRLKDRKQIETWGLSDWMTAMQQLGVTPS